MSEKSDYLKSYIGKKCKIDITPWYNPSSGTIIKSENGWITFETKRAVELINIDRINRIIIKR
jgi:hypothetical protein